MFSWFGGVKAPTTWNVSPSPDHTYIVFAGDDLDRAIDPALAELDANLAETSRTTCDELREAGETDPEIIGAFDDEAKLSELIASAVTVEPIGDVAVARAATADPGAVADATRAVRVRLRAADRVDALVPYALVAVAAAIARRADGRVYDTIGRRSLPDELVAEPLAGLAIGSAGPHVRIDSTTGADGTMCFTTRGLAKYGLFEVALDGVPATLPRASEILAAFVQSIVEPIPPFVPGPWKPEVEYVSAFGVRAFYDDDVGPSASNPSFTALRVRPEPSPCVPWTIVDERGKPLGASGIAKILRAFDADRARAARDSTIAAT